MKQGAEAAPPERPLLCFAITALSTGGPENFLPRTVSELLACLARTQRQNSKLASLEHSVRALSRPCYSTEMGF